MTGSGLMIKVSSTETPRSASTSLHRLTIVYGKRGKVAVKYQTLSTSY